ncbi:MAG: TIM barrel protein [Spirochaetales bacterium]|nr:TIM barrel protein [Spirochaetales bacterium]
MPRDTFFGEIKAIGYQAIEIWQPDDNFGEICELSNRHGLAFSSMAGHETLGDGLNNPNNHSRIEDELSKSIDMAAANRIRNLICFSGNVREGIPRDESITIIAEGLKRVAPYAEEKGVYLILELLNSKIDHPGYECDHTSWGVEVISKVNSSRVKLLYDIYHMQIMEGDLIRTITDNISSIAHFHTAGNPGRNDMDDQQELNYRGISGAISALPYGGYVAHEVFPKGDILAALKVAFDICNV